MNKVTLIGNLVGDPVMRSTPNGTTVATFTLAVNRKYKGSDGNKVTDYIACVAWEQLAELVCKYMKKGSKMAINGNLQTRTWADGDGYRHYVTEVLAEEIEFLSPRTEKNYIDYDENCF